MQRILKQIPGIEISKKQQRTTGITTWLIRLNITDNNIFKDTLDNHINATKAHSWECAFVALYLLILLNQLHRLLGNFKLFVGRNNKNLCLGSLSVNFSKVIVAVQVSFFVPGNAKVLHIFANHFSN